MATNVQFWDRIAPKYAARPIADMESYEQTLARVRSYLSAPDHVLELGAGTGGTARLLAPSVARYTATDVAPEMIRIAQDRGAAEGPDNITCLAAPSADARFAGADMDAVLAFNLLHLLPAQDGTIAAAHAALKPGGYFITKTVCLGDGSWVFRPMVAVMRLIGKAPFVRFFSARDLEAEIEAQGFEIVETGDYGRSPKARFIVARKV